MFQLSFAQIAALLTITPGFVSAIPLTPRATTPLSCPASDGQTVTIGANSFTVQCATDHYGGDLTMSWETTLDACIATCAATPGCLLASYSGGACYMKSVDNGPQTNANVWSAKKVASSSGGISCPASDQKTYTATDGAVFKIECSTDRYGEDLDVTWVPTLEKCIEACESTKGCVDVAYRPGSPGPCYMKKSFTQEARLDTGVWGALRVSTAPSSTTTSSATSTATSSSTTSTTPSATPTPTPPPTCGNIPNPSFEDISNSAWTVTANSNSAYYSFNYQVASSGLTSPDNTPTVARFVTPAINGAYIQFQNTATGLTTGSRYTVSFWAKRTGTSNFYFYINGATLYSAGGTIASWQKYTGTFTATGTTATIAAKAQSIVNSNEFFVDAFSITCA